MRACAQANITGGNHLDQTTHSDLDDLTMGNVPQGSVRLWVHFFSVLLKTCTTILLLDRVCCPFPPFTSPMGRSHAPPLQPQPLQPHAICPFHLPPPPLSSPTLKRRPAAGVRTAPPIRAG